MKDWLLNNLLPIRSITMFFRHIQLAYKINFKLFILSRTHSEEELRDKLRSMTPEELKEMGLSPINFKRK